LKIAAPTMNNIIQATRNASPKCY